MVAKGTFAGAAAGAAGAASGTDNSAAQHDSQEGEIAGANLGAILWFIIGIGFAFAGDDSHVTSRANDSSAHGLFWKPAYVRKRGFLPFTGLLVIFKRQPFS
jgi:hypothetical protein